MNNAEGRKRGIRALLKPSATVLGVQPLGVSHRTPRTHRGNELFLHCPTITPPAKTQPDNFLMSSSVPLRPPPHPPSTLVDLAQFFLPSAQFWSSWPENCALIERLGPPLLPNPTIPRRLGLASLEKLFEEWGTKLFLCCWQKLRHFSGRPGLKWQVKLRSRKFVRCCNTRGAPAEVIELVRRLMAPEAILVWEIGICDVWFYSVREK